MYDTIKETAQFIRGQIDELPKIAIILGTGLGDLVSHMEIIRELNYADIPHFHILQEAEVE